MFCVGGWGKLCGVRVSLFILLAKHYQGDQIKKWQMGCAHNMHDEMRNAYKVLVGKSETGDTLQDQGIEGSKTFKCIFKKEGTQWLDWSASGYRQEAGCFEHDNEPLGSMKCRQFHFWLRTCYLHKKDSAHWVQYVRNCEYV